jgi:hypothetical protein
MVLEYGWPAVSIAPLAPLPLIDIVGVLDIVYTGEAIVILLLRSIVW